MNYQETLAYLDSLGKFGIRLGMERIEYKKWQRVLSAILKLITIVVK